MAEAATKLPVKTEEKKVEERAPALQAWRKKGVLTVTLPKRPEAQKPAKKIEVKAA